MNPRRTIYDTIAEPLAVQGIGHLTSRVDRVTEILTQVGLTPPSSFLFRHPHELSGGQRQRVAIARALVIGPLSSWPMSPRRCWMFPAAPASCR